VMVSDSSRGSVRERAGRVEVRYDVNREDAERFRRGLLLLTELYWAAGATEVYQPVDSVGSLRDGDLGPLEHGELRPSELQLFAFHPLGTARADADPDRGVVDANLRLHGVEGLYVSDASAIPSSLGVNPQITIMALATRLAYGLLGKSPPTDEPEPEKIASPRAPVLSAGP
jgi:choline dehydrogenase-like flavoprotein